MKKMKKVFCALLAMVMVAGVCMIPTEAAEGASTPRETIQAKIDAAEDGATVCLLGKEFGGEDYTWWDGEPVVISKNVTLELLDCNIESLEHFPVFKVESGATFTIMGYRAEIKNALLSTEQESIYDNETLKQIGLFEVEENAKLIVTSGDYNAGYKMFTDNSAGEIVINDGSFDAAYEMFAANTACTITINGGWYKMIPEGNYTIPDWTFMGESRWDDGYYCLMSAIGLGIPVDDIEMPPVEKTYELPVRVTNRAGYAIENVEVQAGYEKCFDAERPYYSFDKAVAGDKYTVSGSKAIIPRIEAGETIWVKFATVIPMEMSGKRISFECQANIIVNGESVDEQSGGTGWFCAHQMTVDTRNSISETEVSKSIANVTAVKKQETETAVKGEVLKLVQDYWIEEEISEERMSVEEINKVSDGFFSGDLIKAELVLKEMAAEQVASSDKTILEEKASSELGSNVRLRYLDLSLLIQCAGEELGTIGTLTEEMAITVAIPDEMKADGGMYKILRSHNGEVAVLDTTVNKDGTITFKTDRFSTYALAYVGKVNVVEDTKTEETVKKETQNVVEQIVAGTVADSVVDEKTAEKVTEAVNGGKTVSAEIVVVKVPENEIAQVEQKAIEEKVTAELGVDAKVQYLDVSIMLMAGDEELGTLNELKEEITITVAIPDELKAEGRIYKVIRNHDGEITVLDTIVNEDGTISFKTDKFSTYALAYADAETTNTNPVIKPTTPSTDSKAPQTGDNSSVMVYVAICLVALAAIVVTKKRNAFVK